MKLYGQPGWGSTLIEAQLGWYGAAFEFQKVGDLFKDREAAQALRALNPLAQVPTLVLEDGQVMTESAAITLHLADVYGMGDLVPMPGEEERAKFLRCHEQHAPVAGAQVIQGFARLQFGHLQRPADARFAGRHPRHTRKRRDQQPESRHQQEC